MRLSTSRASRGPPRPSPSRPPPRRLGRSLASLACPSPAKSLLERLLLPSSFSARPRVPRRIVRPRGALWAYLLMLIHFGWQLAMMALAFSPTTHTLSSRTRTAPLHGRRSTSALSSGQRGSAGSVPTGGRTGMERSLWVVFTPAISVEETLGCSGS